MRNILFSLIIVMVIFSIGIQSILPVTIESGIKEVLENTYPLSNDINVNLKNGLALSILSGHLGELDIKIKKMYVSQVPIEDFEANIKNVKINLAKLLKEKKLIFSSVDEGLIKVTLEQSAINQQIKEQKITGINDIKITLKSEHVILNGQFDLIAGKINAQCYGKLEPSEGAQLVYRPEKISLGGYMIPDNWEKRLLRQINFKFDLPYLPLPIEIKSVKVLEGKLLIEGIVKYNS